MGAQKLQDNVTRAYARLSGLRKRLEEQEHHGGISEMHYIVEYHEALDRLVASGFDVEEFRVKPEQIGSYSPGATKAVQSTLLLAKLDAVLTYFEITTAQPEQPQKAIGFHAPTT